MFNFFRRKKKTCETVTTAKVSKVDVPKTEVEKVDVPKVEPQELKWFEMRYRNTKTGEIFTFDVRDSEAFDKVMSNKDNQMIFG